MNLISFSISDAISHSQTSLPELPTELYQIINEYASEFDFQNMSELTKNIQRCPIAYLYGRCDVISHLLKAVLSNIDTITDMKEAIDIKAVIKKMASSTDVTLEPSTWDAIKDSISVLRVDYSNSTAQKIGALFAYFKNVTTLIIDNDFLVPETASQDSFDRLDWSGERLFCLMQELAKNERIKKLWLRNCDFYESPLPYVSCIPSLTSLKFTGQQKAIQAWNQKVYALFPLLEKSLLPSLVPVHLLRIRALVTTLPPSNGGLQELYFDEDSMNFREVFYFINQKADFLNNLRKLTFIQRSDNTTHCLTDRILQHIITLCPNLEEVDLTGQIGITDRGLLQLKSLTKLKFLNLQSCKLSTRAIEDLMQQMPMLKNVIIPEQQRIPPSIYSRL
ncbi:MAG: hypothetical protein JWO53_421 [Chlamydiia bacterium]|nr:hypothetical protein [Chlamydiia bacterium]